MFWSPQMCLPLSVISGSPSVPFGQNVFSKHSMHKRQPCITTVSNPDYCDVHWLEHLLLISPCIGTFLGSLILLFWIWGDILLEAPPPPPPGFKARLDLSPVRNDPRIVLESPNILSGVRLPPNISPFTHFQGSSQPQAIDTSCPFCDITLLFVNKKFRAFSPKRLAY